MIHLPRSDYEKALWVHSKLSAHIPSIPADRLYQVVELSNRLNLEYIEDGNLDQALKLLRTMDDSALERLEKHVTENTTDPLVFLRSRVPELWIAHKLTLYGYLFNLETVTRLLEITKRMELPLAEHGEVERALACLAKNEVFTESVFTQMEQLLVAWKEIQTFPPL